MRDYHITVSVLHITNGDCAADTLRSFLTDRVLITCDVLHEGPAPLVSDDAWYDARAQFLADGSGARYDETRSGLERFDRMIINVPPEQEIVLWFEHDLFDQLLLIRTLDVLRGPERPALHTPSDGDPRPPNGDGVARSFQGRDPGVSLICIDRFPGVERFIGLGQLSAEQLATLYPTRERVTAEQFALAGEAWRAFRSDDPRELFALLVRLKTDAANMASGVNDTVTNGVSGFGRTSAALPFLADAIHRLFEEYPSTTNGLSRSANAVLRALESTPLDGAALFDATQSPEPRPFIGDSSLFTIVHRLAGGRVPLVAIDPPAAPEDLRGATIQLTAAGREVLTGARDAVALNGIDEWKGGVHLLGQERSPWRWDAPRETLVS